MGKCLKCKVKEAAFLDERGKRAHCHSCKLPGAARHIRKKTKKLSAKVDITKLPARPCVLPVAKIVFAEEAIVTSTNTGTEVTAEIDNFKFEKHLDAFVAKQKIPMQWNGRVYVGNMHGMEFTSTGPKESVKYSGR